ncbi:MULTISPECIES: MASE2 domain-containing protein [unclassified Pseudomonas]|uniref:MASE2 domain-containing protein n=1 Tax=unclassified Pseudomonas TaxID=196821 RepID=UPI000BD078F3|nr:MULTISPECIES: MASE2 domain-containing protein [unclassified Pseudomonas]PVZ16175.1 diguanylate cyclase [Pseudomonas sp. URIL14HWK12:I12]PVZ25969.1 diguanylate cyclase [Pseudomonas sp. URIL14HWK12:I10]PVZ36507.1 diguanylate cyclase [Pseudomonas sp. URIL14HWK12:I11]SNZ18569.1 diguanylate cyclase [Pseudomonas sp. URIL14HWK12:I9]
MHNSRQAGISFAKRVFMPRALGCLLSFVYIAVVIQGTSPPEWVWGAMLINGFVWPWVAQSLALRSQHPYRAEMRNLMLDSLFAGAWVAVMRFNLLPTALLLSMIAMNNVAAAGFGFLLRGLVAKTLGALAMCGLIGLEVRWRTSLEVMIASLPMLVIYPLTVGWTSHALAVKLFQRRKAFDIINSYGDNSRLLAYNPWMSELAADHQRCRRSNGHSTVAIISINGLADLHRRHGHWVAQAISGRLGHIVLAETRGADVVGSNGADEFFILFPGLRERAAAQCLNRIREQFSRFGHADAELPLLSTSAGLAEYSYLQTGEWEWFDSARQAMEAARQLPLAAPLAAG